MSTRETRKELTKVSIIEAAIDTLATSGTLNMTQIAEKVNFTVGAIYRSYFKSQVDILSVVTAKLASWQERYYLKIDELLPSDPVGRLYMYMMLQVEMPKVNPRYFDALMATRIQTTLNPELLDHLTEQVAIDTRIEQLQTDTLAACRGDSDPNTFNQMTLLIRGYQSRAPEFADHYRQLFYIWMSAHGWVLSSSRRDELDKQLKTLTSP